ncbi:hypothetical protein ACF0H5_003090 [Mactra antiquata]
MRRGHIILIFLLGELMSMTWAAVRVDARIRAAETMSMRRSQTEQLRKRDKTPLSRSQLFKLTPGESLEEDTEVDDALGGKVERLHETYKGFKVYDTVVTVRKSKNGELTGDATGHFYQNIDEDVPNTEAKLSPNQALQIALKVENDDEENIGSVKTDKFIYVDKKDGNKAKLVYQLSYLIDGFKRPFYIIDANKGKVIQHWSGFNTYPCCERKYTAIGGNEKIGKITYGNMPYCLAPTIVNGTCYLENEYVRVVDMENTRHNNITETASFLCDEGYGDEVNGAYSPATDAFFYGTVVGKMFEEWFGGTALKEKIILRVHFSEYMENAFWNGVNCTFGDGGSDLYPLTSLDVVGHEIGHGITEQSSNLAYYDEHGGVNEAFSDIMGEAAERYLLESDFLTGGSIMKNSSYLREFETPENDGVSISKVSDMNDSIPVHFSSGVYRRVWYVLVKQEGMPIREAATVFLHANKMYWHSTASFHDCACGLLMAALDLGYSTLPFNVAFSDVGIDHCEVESHILGLNKNRTVSDITVTESVNPVFKFTTPEWADTLIVDATGTYPTWISVFIGGWEASNDACGEEKGEVIAEGIDTVYVPNAEDKQFYMKFSRHGSDMSNTTLIGFNAVDITAGYTCQQNFSEFNWWYLRDCGLKLPDY